jgi:hypothetical protein
MFVRLANVTPTWRRLHKFLHAMAVLSYRLCCPSLGKFLGTQEVVSDFYPEYKEALHGRRSTQQSAQSDACATTIRRAVAGLSAGSGTTCGALPAEPATHRFRRPTRLAAGQRRVIRPTVNSVMRRADIAPAIDSRGGLHPVGVTSLSQIDWPGTGSDRVCSSGDGRRCRHRSGPSACGHGQRYPVPRLAQ